MADLQEHVLITMADTQVSTVFERVLRTAGYSVSVNQEGNSAIKQASLNGASLVILGERLKDGAGIDFAADFARRLPAVPLVMMVAQDSPDMLRRILRLGVSDYICPP